jgi:hypothetical protein
MITINNYQDTVKNLDYSTLPATYWKTHTFIEKASENYTNWNAYNSNEGIKKLMDAYFVKLDEFLQKHEVKPNFKTTTTEEKPTEKIAKVVAPIKTAKISMPPTSQKETDDDMDFSFVERIPEELKILKRFVAMNGKKKTKDDFLRFINALHRAIVEKKIRKASPYAKQLEYIQEKLVMRFNEMTKPVTVEISEKTIYEFKNLIAQERVMPSVMLIKRYITLNGKYGVKDKAQLLINAMQKAVKLKKITKSDKYNKLLDQMHANLLIYIRSKTQKILSIPQAELNGLNGLLGCGCEMNGIDEELAEVSCLEPDNEPTKPLLPNGVMSSMDFSNVQFKTLGFVGKYRKLIGDPSKGFSVMVYGKPKMGKSFLCVDFAGYLARNHGKVLYIAREEGLDMTLQDKLNAKDVKHPNLFISEDIPSDLTPYDFIFFDSVNKLGLSTSDLETLKNNNPGKSFIYIFQTTKDGNFRGANEFQHEVDVVIQIPEKGLAVQNGRFNQGGEMKIFEDSVIPNTVEFNGVKKTHEKKANTQNLSNELPFKNKASRFPDWTEPKHLNPSDWQKLKHIKKCYDEGNFAEAMDYAMYSADTMIREEIPPNVWKDIGGQLTSTGKEKLKALLEAYPEI